MGGRRIIMCEKCIHYDVCKYKDSYTKFTVKIPGNLEPVVKVTVSCQAFKDERYYKTIRPMGAEV